MFNNDPNIIKKMQDTLQRKNMKKGGSLEANKRTDKETWNQKQN